MRRNCPHLDQCVPLSLGLRQTLDAPESLKGKRASRMFFELGKPFLSCPDSERPCPDIRQKVGNAFLENASRDPVRKRGKPDFSPQARRKGPRSICRSPSECSRPAKRLNTDPLDNFLIDGELALTRINADSAPDSETSPRPRECSPPSSEESRGQECPRAVRFFVAPRRVLRFHPGL